jgi:hypothetical protein
LESDDFVSVFVAGCSVFAAPSEDDVLVSASLPAPLREPRPESVE